MDKDKGISIVVVKGFVDDILSWDINFYLGSYAQTKRTFIGADEIFFLTNPEIRKLIPHKHTKKLGGFIIFNRKRDKDFTFYFYPFSDGNTRFKEKGIASKLELLILRYLKKQGYGNYHMRHSCLSLDRERQLKERFGKRYTTIFTNPPSLNTEINALQKYIKNENLKRNFKAQTKLKEKAKQRKPQKRRI